MEVIQDEDRLLRRVQFLDPNFIMDDGTVASSCFRLKTGENGLSVDLERLTTHAMAIQDKSRFRLYALKAGFTTSLGLDILHDPLKDNYAHTLILGQISRGVSRKLAGE